MWHAGTHMHLRTLGIPQSHTMYTLMFTYGQIRPGRYLVWRHVVNITCVVCGDTSEHNIDFIKIDFQVQEITDVRFRKVKSSRLRRTDRHNDGIRFLLQCTWHVHKGDMWVLEYLPFCRHLAFKHSLFGCPMPFAWLPWAFNMWTDWALTGELTGS